MESPNQETVNLLRPQQVFELENEKRGLENTLDDPDAKNKGDVRRKLKKLNSQMDSQVPQPLSGEELDKAVSESAELEGQIKDGMLSQEEMRKNPAGAVGAHLRWEKANKKRISRWKHLQLRIHAGTDDPDVANMERFRPVRNSMNMDTVQIQGKSFYFPPGDIKSRNHMSEEDRAKLAKETDDALARADSKLGVESEPEAVVTTVRSKKKVAAN